MKLPRCPHMTPAEAHLMSHARRAAYALRLRESIMTEPPEQRRMRRVYARSWAGLARESWEEYVRLKESRHG